MSINVNASVVKLDNQFVKSANVDTAVVEEAGNMIKRQFSIQTSVAFLQDIEDNLGLLVWDGRQAEVLSTVNLTDDPALTGNTLMSLPAGSTVTYLSTMFNTDGWEYIETTLNGQTIRGFVPQGSLSVTGEDPTESIDPGEGDG